MQELLLLAKLSEVTVLELLHWDWSWVSGWSADRYVYYGCNNKG